MKTFPKFRLVALLCLAPSIGLAQSPVPAGYVTSSSITDNTTAVTFGRHGYCANGFAWTEAVLWRLSDYLNLGHVYYDPSAQVLSDLSNGAPGIPYLNQGPGTYWIQYRLVDNLYDYTDQWFSIAVSKYSLPAFADGTNLPVSAYDAPTFWNAGGVQPYNNCYNYATNKQTNTFAQPGLAHGYYLSSLTATDVATGAANDGLLSSDPGDGSAKIAMLIDTGVDYHWVRLDNNLSNWSHKPGGTAATDRDASYSVITSPAAANWNYGTLNYSYAQDFYTPSDVIQGYGHANIY